MCEQNDWIALVYKLPAIPSRFRVKVWRQLKKVGAIYLQQSVAVLPNSEHFCGIMEEIKTEILTYGGEATLMSFSFCDKKDAVTAYNSFNNGLSKEYDVIGEIENRIYSEIESTRKANHLTLEFLRQKLNDLQKLRSSYNSVMLKDCYKLFISSSFGEHIDTLLLRVQKDIHEFETSINPTKNS